MRVARMAALAIALGIGAAAGISQGPAQHAVPPEEQRIDINHATIEELLRVPGMTKSWAGRIVRFRPYRSKNELLDRGIVSGDVYKRIKDYIIAHREPPR